MENEQNFSAVRRVSGRTREFISVLWVIAVTTAVAAAVTVIGFFPARAQSAQTTQTFRPARFALEVAEINVKMQQTHGENTQKRLFKIDTVTGEVWTLQLTTSSYVDPQVISVNWIKVPSGLLPAAPSVFQQF